MEETKAALSLDLTDLRRLRDEVGRMPPAPPTWRGRIGAPLVSVVRRALFWVWPPLHRFFDVLCRLLERLIRMVEQLDARVTALDAQHGDDQSVTAELAAIRAQRAHMDSVQADLWLEVTRLKAQLAELRSSALDRDSVPLG
jgi:hypothetical protein